MTIESRLRVSACVPCFNCERTLAVTLESVRRQTIPIDDVVVIDDGSTDASAAIARACGARVVAYDENLGRGAARARGMVEARHGIILWVDATGSLPVDFVATALPWFDNPAVAAVFARADDPVPNGVAGRWRARHLFRVDAKREATHHASLITGGSVLLRSAVMSVGNFNAAMHHAEDAELGSRLLAAGYDVVSDPRLRVISIGQNTVRQVLERYWRWGVGVDEAVSLRWYAKQVAYSVKVMARQDLEARDVLCLPLSLWSPHYQFWRTVALRMNRALTGGRLNS